MKNKFYPIQIMFLDENLNKSAEYQTNKTLIKSINGCIQALLSARFYYNGIRSKKIYDWYFNKEKLLLSLQDFFPGWPLKKKPSYSQYSSRTSKWCRQCKEHYDLVMKYLDIMLLEYDYRFNKQHNSQIIYDWILMQAPELKIPYANLNKIVLPWKCLNPKYRKRDIVQGYRTQYLYSIEEPFEAYNDSKRDIPDFVLQFFNLDI